jgi:hypothetical protein
MVMVDGDRWQRLDACDAGEVSKSTRDRFAAEAIFRRGTSPATSMADLQARFAPAQPLPPELVADAVDVARDRSGEGADAAERAWMRMVLEQHLASNEPLSDQHAARLVADVQSVGLRDYAAAVITRGHAREHGELWREVATRTPAELRAPVASLAAYSFFMGGDGLSTRLALQQAPRDYPLARLIGTLARSGGNPNTMPMLGELLAAPEAPSPHADSPSAPSPSPGARAQRATPSTPNPGRQNPGSAR